MPRKAKSKSENDVASPNPSRVRKRRKSSSRRKLSETTTGETTPFSEIRTVLLFSDPTEDVWICDSYVGDDALNHKLPKPRSAWFVFGSDESFQSDDDLAEAGGIGEWTATRNVEVGDILFFYFIAPKTAVHFVARATSKPVRDTWSGGAPQWWVKYDSMIRIDPPITLSEIRKIFGEERLLLYCQGGKYIRPDFANSLLEKAGIISPSKQCEKNALRRVIGKKELGDPNTITLAGLRKLKSARFVSEEDVEYHVLEPLLRLAQVEKYARIQRRYDLPNNKTADYAALDGQNGVLCIIEAKLHVSNAAVSQAREYATTCNAPVFVLIDCDRVLCYRTHEETPRLTIDRKRLDDNSLRALRAHILNQELADAKKR